MGFPLGAQGLTICWKVWHKLVMFHNLLLKAKGLAKAFNNTFVHILKKILDDNKWYGTNY